MQVQDYRTMIIGITGTEKGMTLAQYNSAYDLIRKLSSDHNILHHGDCLGADAEFHVIAEEFGFRIHIHPPLNSSFHFGKLSC